MYRIILEWEEEEEKRGEEDRNGIKDVAHSSWRKRFEVGSRAAHDARTMREALVAPQATHSDVL